VIHTLRTPSYIHLHLHTHTHTHTHTHLQICTHTPTHKYTICNHVPCSLSIYYYHSSLHHRRLIVSLDQHSKVGCDNHGTVSDVLNQRQSGFLFRIREYTDSLCEAEARTKAHLRRKGRSVTRMRGLRISRAYHHHLGNAVKHTHTHTHTHIHIHTHIHTHTNHHKQQTTNQPPTPTSNATSPIIILILPLLYT
jgi:hypothetical protein